MKKDRDCGVNYPVYPMMQGIPMMQGMPMMNMGFPNTGMNSTIPTGSIMTNVNTNNYDEEIRRLEQRVNMLDRRVTALETSGNSSSNYNTYNSSGYQML